MRMRRTKRIHSILINWERVVDWLVDMEDVLPEGQYLHVCGLIKKLHSSANTTDEQRRILDELKRSEHEQWELANRNPLTC